jgi:hypothetical protein
MHYLFIGHLIKPNDILMPVNNVGQKGMTVDVSSGISIRSWALKCTMEKIGIIVSD